MKPPRFRYRLVSSASEAVAALTRYGADAKLLAGGQSLMPAMNMRLVRPTHLIDLNGATELDYIRDAGDELHIGALTRHRTLEDSPLVAAHAPLLARVMPYVGHTAIRYRGTLGGSLAHADPAAELASALTTLDGRVVAVGPEGSRTIDIAELYMTYFTTTLAPDELITEVRVPKQPAGAGVAVQQIARRHGDFALVGVLAAAHPGGDGVPRLRLTAMGVSGVPLRLREIERLADGRRVDDELLNEAAALAEQAVEPESDMHASEEYRRHMTGVLVRRAIAQAAGQASTQ